MTEHLFDIHDHLAAATESSIRSRRILALLIAASILVFIAFWDSRDSCWIRTHVQWAEKIEALYKNPPARADLWTDQQRALKRRAETYHIENSDEAEHFHQRLLDLMAENMLYVHVPVLGIAFDINDLGIFSGLTFAVLLLWFLFALWHEWHNMQVCIAESHASDKRKVYRYLAMRQLFTTPPSLEKETRHGIWTWLIFVLFAMPALAYSLVVVYDLLFSDELPSTPGLSIELRGEVLCLALVLGLSILCIRLLWKIDRTWRTFARGIRKAQS